MDDLLFEDTSEFDAAKFNDDKLRMCLLKNKYKTNKLPSANQFGTNLRKEGILSAHFIQCHPEALTQQDAKDFTARLGKFFLHDKIKALLQALDKEFAGVDIVCNRKALKDVMIKVLFRGGKLDDVHRAMVLISEGGQSTFDRVVDFMRTECTGELDWSWEDDQLKTGWPCVKFLVFSRYKTLYSKVCPVEVQVLPVATFIALKQSVKHLDYEIDRMAGIGDCNKLW